MVIILNVPNWNTYSLLWDRMEIIKGSKGDLLTRVGKAKLDLTIICNDARRIRPEADMLKPFMTMKKMADKLQAVISEISNLPADGRDNPPLDLPR